METIRFKILDNVVISTMSKDKRKTRTLRKELAKAIKELIDAIDLSESTKYAFFWQPGNKSQRRSGEKKLSFEVAREFNFVSYSTSQEVTMSCRNVYISKETKVNEVETNLRKIKSVLEELKLLQKVLEAPKKYMIKLTRSELKELQEEAAAEVVSIKRSGEA